MTEEWKIDAPKINRTSTSSDPTVANTIAPIILHHRASCFCPHLLSCYRVGLALFMSNWAADDDDDDDTGQEDYLVLGIKFAAGHRTTWLKIAHTASQSRAQNHHRASSSGCKKKPEPLAKSVGTIKEQPREALSGWSIVHSLSSLISWHLPSWPPPATDTSFINHWPS